MNRGGTANNDLGKLAQRNFSSRGESLSGQGVPLSPEISYKPITKIVCKSRMAKAVQRQEKEIAKSKELLSRLTREERVKVKKCFDQFFDDFEAQSGRSSPEEWFAKLQKKQDKPIVQKMIRPVIDMCIASVMGSFQSVVEAKINEVKERVKEVGTRIALGFFVVYLMDRYAQGKLTFAMGVAAYLVVEAGLFMCDCQSLTAMLYDFVYTRMSAQAISFDYIKEFLVLSAGSIFFMQDLKSTKHSVVSFLKNLGSFRRDFGGMCEFFMNTAMELFDWISSKISGKSYFSTRAYMIPKAREWIAEVETMLESSFRGTLSRNIANAERILTLERVGCELLSDVIKLKEKGMELVLKNLCRKLNSLREEFAATGIYTKGVRPEPVMLMFRGSSGNGKSTLLRPLMCEVLASVLEETQLDDLKQDPDSFFYARNPETGYVDGYKYQPVWFQDDYGQIPSTMASAENEQIGIIRNGNIFPVMLHMADLASKGSVYFRSKFVVCSSNVRDVLADAHYYVKQPEAVERRFHINCVVCPKKEFSTASSRDDPWDRRLDINKVGQSFDKDIYEFVLEKRDYLTGKVSVVEVLDYDALVSRIISIYRANAMRAESSKEDTLRAVERGIERRMNAQAGGWTQMQDIDNVGSADSLEDSEIDYSDDRIGYGFFSRLYYTVARALVSARLTIDPSYLDSWKLPEQYIVSEGYVRAFRVEDIPKHDSSATGVGKAMRKLGFDEDMCDFYFALSTASRVSNINVHPLLSIGYQHGLDMLVISKDAHLVCKVLSLDVRHNLRFMMCVLMCQHVVPETNVPKVYNLTQISSPWFRYLVDDMERDVFVTRKTADPLGVMTLLRYGGIIVKDKLVRFTSIAYDYKYTIASVLAGAYLLKQVVEKTLSIFDREDKSETEIRAQGQDTMGESVMRKIMFKNYYSITYDDDVLLGYGFFLRDKVFIYPYHFNETMDNLEVYKSGKVLLKHIGSERKFELSREKFRPSVVDKKNDTCSVILPDVPNHSDITTLIVSREDVTKFARGKAIFVDLGKTYPRQAVIPYRICPGIPYSASVNTYCPPRIAWYDYDTQTGMCGLPVFIENTALRSARFLGIHVAGGGAAGCCTILSDSVIFKSQSGEERRTMVLYKELSRAPGTNRNTSILKSPLYGKWGPAKTKPCHLRKFTSSDGTEINPWSKAISGYDVDKPEFDSGVVSVAVELAVSQLVSNSKFCISNLRVLTYKEVIEGIPGEEYYGSIERSTSAGYPWNLSSLPGYSGKERFFGRGVDIEWQGGPDGPKLLRMLDNDLALLKAGKRPEYYFTGCLKDERKPIEKVDSGKTRYFAACPITYFIMFSCYFKSFSVECTRSRLLSYYTVGINVYSGEWDVIAKRLSTHSQHCLDGDFGSFDKKQVRDILRLIGDKIIDVIGGTDEEKLIRKILWIEVYSSRHIHGKNVMEWSASLPSGHPFTSLINSVYVVVLYIIAYVELTGKSARSFFRDVCIFSGGDDSIASISPAVVKQYNGVTLAKFFAQKGLEFTTASKSTEHVMFKPLEECEFLKRAFRYEEVAHKYVGPLRLETCLESPYWTKKGEFRDVIPTTNVEVALHELSLHEPRVFDEWYPRIRSAAMSELSYHPVYSSRKSYLMDTLRWGEMEVGLIFGNRRRLMLINGEGVDINAQSGKRTFYDLASVRQNLGQLRTEVVREVLGPFLFRDTTQDGTERHQCPGYPSAGTVWANRLQRKWPAANQNKIINEALASTENAETTVFNNDAGGAVAKFDALTNQPFKMVALKELGDYAELKSFFSRPHRVYSGDWSDTLLAGANLFRLTIPDDVAVGSPWIEKMFGFLAFRATTVIRVMVNASPFQQGRLIMSWCPQYQELGRTYLFQSLTQMTQLPHVELDIGCETEMVARFPYVSPTPYSIFQNLAHTVPPSGSIYQFSPTFGDVSCNVYSPLASGDTPTSVGVTAYVSFEDVEVVVPAWTGQSGRRMKKNPTTEEVDKPVSTALMKVSKATAYLGEIPLLSQFMFPLSWAAAQVSKAVSVFGYSAPVVDTPVHRVVRVDNMGMTNYDTPVGAVVLGGSCVNSIQHNPAILGSDIDEMSLKYVAGIYAFVTEFPWATTTPTDFELYGTAVYPESFLGATLTPVSFISRLFRYQRGGMKVRIKVVKTRMHSGRLALIFNPGSGVSVPVGRNNYLLRQIVDLRESSEIEFVIPYLLPNPWRSTTLGLDPTPLGHFKIVVHDELRGPSTVSNTVRLLVEWCAADDFEVSGMVTPTMSLNRSTSLHAANPRQITFRAQSVDPSVVNGCRAATGVMGSIELEQEGISHLTLIPGEAINSLKQYLMVMRNYFTIGATGTGNERVVWWQDNYRNNSLNPAVAFGSQVWDIIHFCYAYRTGSTRYFIWDQGNTGRLTQNYVMNRISLSYDDLDNAVSIVSRDINQPPEGAFAHYNVQSNPIFQASPYPMTSLRIIKLYGPLSQAQSPSNISITNLVQESYACQVSRSLGEDGRLGYFLSVPPLLF